MKEPKRLLAQGATDFERQLLSSVMNERPSTLLRSRMQRGLGLVGPLAWASNVKAMFSSLGSQAKVGVAALGVVAAGAIGVVTLAPSSQVANAPRESMSEAAPARFVEASPAAVSAEVVAAAALTPPVADVETVPAKGGSSQLRDEIALLDAARSALQQGSRSRALASLNEYEERFPSGILERESLLLLRQATRGAAPRRKVPSGTGQRRP
jgi:hypothetical protein